jgi:hypothetical protein
VGLEVSFLLYVVVFQYSGLSIFCLAESIFEVPFKPKGFEKDIQDLLVVHFRGVNHVGDGEHIDWLSLLRSPSVTQCQALSQARQVSVSISVAKWVI